MGIKLNFIFSHHSSQSHNLTRVLIKKLYDGIAVEFQTMLVKSITNSIMGTKVIAHIVTHNLYSFNLLCKCHGKYIAIPHLLYCILNHTIIAHLVPIITKTSF